MCQKETLAATLTNIILWELLVPEKWRGGIPAAQAKNAYRVSEVLS